MALVFGIVGYLMVKTGYPTAPLVLALILTPMLESSVRQALEIAHGSPIVFVTRPIAVILLAAGLALITSSLISRRRRIPHVA